MIISILEAREAMKGYIQEVETKKKYNRVVREFELFFRHIEFEDEGDFGTVSSLLKKIKSGHLDNNLISIKYYI